MSASNVGLYYTNLPIEPVVDTSYNVWPKACPRRLLTQLRLNNVPDGGRSHTPSFWSCWPLAWGWTSCLRRRKSSSWTSITSCSWPTWKPEKNILHYRPLEDSFTGCWTNQNLNAWYPVWPDLPKFQHFGKIIIVLGTILGVSLVLENIKNLPWPIFHAIG